MTKTKRLPFMLVAVRLNLIECLGMGMSVGGASGRGSFRSSPHFHHHRPPLIALYLRRFPHHRGTVLTR